jgi:hypothetical protein
MIFHILMCAVITILIFSIVFLVKYLFKRHHWFHTFEKSHDNYYCNVDQNQFNKIFLLVIWILLVVLEIIKMMIFAILYKDNRLWIYLSIHVCSLALYLLPILIFTSASTKLHKIVFNFTFVTLFLCTVSFMIGFDTPDILAKNYFNETTGNVFYAYHSYFWHILLVLIFAYLVIFRFETMYYKFNLQIFFFIFMVNFYIFFMTEILRAAGLPMSSVAWILYNHDLEPFFTWCGHNPYLTNFLLFILTSLIYEGSYFSYFYIEKKITKTRAKPIPPPTSDQCNSSKTKK